jgi:predicted metal-binding protein
MLRLLKESKNYPIKLLYDYFTSETYNYCKSCEYFSKCLTCPSETNDNQNILNDYLKKYSTFKLIIHQSPYSFDEYNFYRHIIDSYLLSLENEYTISLYPGRCISCDCCNELNCQLNNLKRFSLESLGIDVSKLYFYIFNESLLWTNNKFIFVSALLWR